MTADEVTIVVLNWSRGDETVGCLESLARASLGGASILVVDNGSRDGSVATIRGRFPDQAILELPENRGYAGGNNAGMRAALEAGAGGVLLLNNDTRVRPDFLIPLLWAMNDEPRAGAVSSAILREDCPEMLDVAYSEVHFDRRSVVCLQGVNTPPGFGFDTRRTVQVAVGCSLLMNAEALRVVGLFDEAYFAYHEDVDWCIRAWKAGFTIIWQPLSTVLHRRSVSTRALAGPPPPAPAVDDGEALLNAEPPPWNPVRSYLGARNVVRLLRRYATEDEQRYYVHLCRRELPLEFFAIVMGKQGWLTLGRWDWRQMVRYYFVERHRRVLPHGRFAFARVLLLAVLVPIDLLCVLPRDIWRAWRQSRLRPFFEELRGLVDGYLDRPLPLRRLGLR